MLEYHLLYSNILVNPVCVRGVMLCSSTYISNTYTQKGETAFVYPVSGYVTRQPYLFSLRPKSRVHEYPDWVDNLSTFLLFISIE